MYMYTHYNLNLIHRLQIGMSFGVHTQSPSHVQVVLTCHVTQVKIVLTSVAHAAVCCDIARGWGHAYILHATSVRAAQLAVDFGVADLVVRAILVYATAL
jgi:NAD(P)H-dependent flavin oxidoreductase YrpB (nitropropane dioxygenase family)